MASCTRTVPVNISTLRVEMLADPDLVPVPAHKTYALRFMRYCDWDLRFWIANLWEDHRFPPSYTAPEQYHIWTIPSGESISIVSYCRIR